MQTSLDRFARTVSLLAAAGNSANRAVGFIGLQILRYFARGEDGLGTSTGHADGITFFMFAG
ncbi:hypothetical protein D3C76_1800640 [compost metagenome]